MGLPVKLESSSLCVVPSDSQQSTPPPLESQPSSLPTPPHKGRGRGRATRKCQIGSVDDDVRVNLERVFALSWPNSDFILEALRTERQQFAEELQRRKIRILMSMR